MNDEKVRTVVMQPPGQGAYRITVVGAQSQTVAKAFSAAGEPVEIALRPDRYNATIESASSAGATSQEFTVEPAGPDDAAASVQLGADPDFDLSSALPSLPRPRRSAAPVAISSPVWDALSDASPNNAPDTRLPDGGLPFVLPDRVSRFHPTSALPLELIVARQADLEQRAFTLSLSTCDLADTAPLDAPEWRAAQSQIEVVQSCDSEITLKLLDSQWPPSRAALRLTIAVEGRAPWRVGVPALEEGVWLMLRPALAATRPDLVVTMRPVDELTATLIGAVQRALPNEVDSLLVASARAIAGNDWAGGHPDTAAALEALMAHGAAPWASVAAALLMVRTGQIADAGDIAQALGAEYDWIADASVAAAWAAAAAADNDADTAAHCLALLAHARRIGPPCLAASNTLALQMLTAMATNATLETDAEAYRDERRLWGARSRRAVPIGAFFGWELDADTLPLELQPSSDSLIAYGSVTGMELRCRVAEPA